MNGLDLKNVRIQTDRLIQVPVRIKDAEDIFREFTDEITVYMSPKAMESRQETAEFIRSAQAALERGTDLQLAVLDRETGEFLGCSGIHQLDGKTPELGIWIKKSAFGHRYGLEAVGGLIGWIREHLNVELIRYLVEERNFPSRRIPEFYGGVPVEREETVSGAGRLLRLMIYHIK